MELKVGSRGIFLNDDEIMLGTVTEVHDVEEFDIEFHHGGTASPVSAHAFLAIEDDEMFKSLSCVFEKFEAYNLELELEGVDHE